MRVGEDGVDERWRGLCRRAVATVQLVDRALARDWQQSGRVGWAPSWYGPSLSEDHRAREPRGGSRPSKPMKKLVLDVQAKDEPTILAALLSTLFGVRYRSVMGDTPTATKERWT